VRASLANVRCGRGRYRPIDIDRSPWDVFVIRSGSGA
jgi:hypothetical protein